MPGSTRELGREPVWHPLTLWQGRSGGAPAGAGQRIQGAAPLWCNLTSRWLASIEPAIGQPLDRLALAAMLDLPGGEERGPVLAGVTLEGAEAADGGRAALKRWDDPGELERALARDAGRIAAVVVGPPPLDAVRARAYRALDLGAVRELCDRHLVPLVCDQTTVAAAAGGGEALERLAPKLRLLRGLLAEIAAMEEVDGVRARGFVVGIDLGRHASAVRMGHRVTLAARERDALVRSLGDTVVLTPPLAISAADLRGLADVTAEAIRAAHEAAYGIRTPAEAHQLAPKPISHPPGVELAA
ncbi:MAG TPA: hypothetical protein VIL04_02520 [Solirubrobacterales bacterium]|jgi:hypothetical protein